jgi:Flp pilus assembly CpaF family ATPase
MMDDGKLTIREEQARRLAESMKRQLGAFCLLLEERDVIELMLNADGRLWVDRLGQPMHAVGKLVPPVIDSAVDFRIDGSAMTEMHRDRETDCREEVCGEAQR